MRENVSATAYEQTSTGDCSFLGGTQLGTGMLATRMARLSKTYIDVITIIMMTIDDDR